MRCRDAQALCSSYMDGELDDARASAVRGHLRICPACAAYAGDLMAIRDTAAYMEPVDPPQSLWGAIERGLAEAEIADARRSWLWLRWQGARPALLPTAVAALAVAVLTLWIGRQLGDDASAVAQDRPAVDVNQADVNSPGPRKSVGPASGAAAPMDEPEFYAQRTREVLDADRRYIDTIVELREILDEDQESWPAGLRSAYKAQVAELQAAAELHRRQLAGQGAPDPVRRDDLYAVYRAEIALLQAAVLEGPEVFVHSVEASP